MSYVVIFLMITKINNKDVIIELNINTFYNFICSFGR